jgi:hypothetical protein
VLMPSRLTHAACPMPSSGPGKQATFRKVHRPGPTSEAAQAVLCEYCRQRTEAGRPGRRRFPECLHSNASIELAFDSLVQLVESTRPVSTAGGAGIKDRGAGRTGWVCRVQAAEDHAVRARVHRAKAIFPLLGTCISRQRTGFRETPEWFISVWTRFSETTARGPVSLNLVVAGQTAHLGPELVRQDTLLVSCLIEG